MLVGGWRYAISLPSVSVTPAPPRAPWRPNGVDVMVVGVLPLPFRYEGREKEEERVRQNGAPHRRGTEER